MRSPIKTISLQREIMQYIENYIKEEGLKCGEKLPPQSELAEMMNVSRTSLREAVRSMEAQGLLDVRNGKGVYAGEKFQTNVVQTMLTFHKEKEQLAEILEVRSIFEKEILKMVIKRITDEEIEELGVITEKLMKKYHAKEYKAEEDKAFHCKIYSCCHNSAMMNIMQSVITLLNKFWESPLEIEDPFEDGMPYHEKLYEAIRDRNLKGALQANEKIIEDIREEILSADAK